MSLLDTGNEIVLVYPQVESVDEYGTPVFVTSPDPVAVPGMAVQPLTSSESSAEGSDKRSEYRVIGRGRGAPVGPYARATWDGRDFVVIGQPHQRRRTSAVRHLAFIMREVAPDGVGESPASSDGSGSA